MKAYVEVCKKATTVAYAFYLHYFKNATIVAYVGSKVAEREGVMRLTPHSF